MDRFSLSVRHESLRAPFGRGETWQDSPAGYPQDEPYTWWRGHDEYEEKR